MTGAVDETVALVGLVQRHFEEAGRVELEAGSTRLQLRRMRLLSAARYHRDYAELARKELP
ncbi:hypothetical protein GBZ48_21475 [Azospirillum melinis]|uniref:Uncharacterized protein n=1 Tax=Azospirillum melinis TaxID=328839 RepID=A0ABX2KGJ1_9PROT|nr:hypothetical protein [Azospirillum melinis]MBP2309414.1 hypothetical protein [Azospirillum melinis]NUB01828.1 hypothetical protein [Azospirillum melinis]